MSNNNYISLENDGHAIHVIEEKVPRFYVNDPMFKLGRLIEGIKCKLVDVSREDLNNKEAKINHKKWIEEGIDVEILKIGDLRWQKGKLRIKVQLEFCPDELESPLDEFREFRQEN